MNTSTNTNQTHDTTKITARTTPAGFRLRTMAGALLIAGLTASAVGFAAGAHADDGAPGLNIDTPAIAPALVAPWLPTIDRFGSRWHLNCGFPGWHGPFQCWY